MKLSKVLHNILKKCRNIDEKEIDYESAKTILKNDSNAILIDVRSKQEYEEEHLDRAINFPLYDLEKNCECICNNKDNTIIIYCQSGNRSKRAMKVLEENGYTHLYEIKGGLDSI